MAASSSQNAFESSGSDSEEQERNRKRFKDVQRRTNRPQKYKTEWESETAFKGWLKPVKDDALKAKCIACNSEFVADISVIKNHSKGAKHGKFVRILRPSQLKIDVSISEGNEAETEVVTLEFSHIFGACALNLLERCEGFWEKLIQITGTEKIKNQPELLIFLKISEDNQSSEGDYGEDRGYFGLFTVCKILPYNRERCGKDYSKFRPSIVVWIAGILAATGVAILGVFCLCSILQLAMLTSKEKVVMKYSVVVILKLALGLLATLLAIAAAGLFALQTDEHNTSGIHITRGPGFYIQILLIVLNAILFVMALYDVFFSRRPGGNPTQVADPPVAETIGNPGFRDRPQKSGEISMTDASGKPYLASSTTTTNGSMNSVNTTSTTLGSNGSSFTLPKPPARSSLKKKPADGLGIQNPGFSGSSPTFSRNGSMKKVRIQTHSTDV